MAAHEQSVLGQLALQAREEGSGRLVGRTARGHGAREGSMATGWLRGLVKGMIIGKVGMKHWVEFWGHWGENLLSVLVNPKMSFRASGKKLKFRVGLRTAVRFPSDFRSFF